MVKTPSSNCVKSYAIGLTKGFVVTKHKKVERPSDRKNKTSSRVRSIRTLIRSVTGLSSFEKRLMEMYKTGVPQVEKRAFRILKKRLGTRHRAMKKKADLEAVIKNQAKKTKEE